MKKFLNRKSVLIHITAILLIQIIIISFQSTQSSGRSLFSTVAIGITTPFQSGAKFSLEWIAEKWNTYFNLKNSNVENAKLKREIINLKQKITLMGKHESRITQLEKLLEFQQHVEFLTEPARVIGWSPSLQNSTVFINKGSSANILRFQPTINEHGVLGIVLNTTPLTSQVQLLTDRNSAAAVITDNSRIMGVIRGRGNDALELLYVDRRSNIQLGEKVLTSGLDGIFPPDLLIGEISKIEIKNELFLEVTVTPAVDFRQLETMLIILKDITPLTFTASGIEE